MDFSLCLPCFLSRSRFLQMDVTQPTASKQWRTQLVTAIVNHNECRYFRQLVPLHSPARVHGRVLAVYTAVRSVLLQFSLQRALFKQKRTAINPLHSICKEKELGQLALLPPRCGRQQYYVQCSSQGEWKVEQVVFFLLTMLKDKHSNSNSNKNITTMVTIAWQI